MNKFALLVLTSLSLAADVRKDMVFSRTDVELDKQITDFQILGSKGVWDLKIMKWTQDESGNDILTEQNNVIVKPVFKKMFDDVSENVAIGVRKYEKTDVEQSYKIFLHKREQDTNIGGVNYQIDYVVKASIPPVESIKHYKAECFENKTIVKNDGTVRMRFFNDTQKIDILPGSQKVIEANQASVFVADKDSKRTVECSNK